MSLLLGAVLLLLLCSQSHGESGQTGVQESRKVPQQADAVVEERDIKCSDLLTELRELREAVSTLKRQIEEERSIEQVAFGAALGSGGHRGPFDTEITLVYGSVLANAGNAYNASTGIFTAPVRGVYYFSFTGNNMSSRNMGLRLMNDGQQMVTAFNHMVTSDDTRPETTTNGMNLLLEKGDQVYMSLRADTWIFDNGNHHSTFVGHLLFPL
ncbi:cerebellin-4-like [Engraulis encrasicolus]|uniref:cerebellin-4-like n=1 Tax=Engraulis encrasicolus TaxID=184585 RepID=UPI002FD71FE8